MLTSTASPSMTVAVGEAHAARCVAVEQDLGHLHPGAQIDAVLAMQFGEHLREFRAQDGKQWQGGGLEHRHVGVGLAGGRGNLEADPPTADDDQPLARAERRANRRRNHLYAAGAARSERPHRRPAGDAATTRWRAAACRRAVPSRRPVGRRADRDVTAFACVPRRRSMRFAAYHCSGWTTASVEGRVADEVALRQRRALVGRQVPRRRSARSRDPDPASRSACAALAAASPPPTMTNVLMGFSDRVRVSASLAGEREELLARPCVATQHA